MSLANHGGNNRQAPKISDVNQPSPPKKQVGEEKVNTNKIDRLLPPVEDKIIKKQVSIYLDEDVITALNEFGKARGKGAKSDLVNNFLKEAFGIRQGEQ